MFPFVGFIPDGFGGFPFLFRLGFRGPCGIRLGFPNNPAYAGVTNRRRTTGGPRIRCTYVCGKRTMSIFLLRATPFGAISKTLGQLVLPVKGAFRLIFAPSAGFEPACVLGQIDLESTPFGPSGMTATTFLRISFKK